MHLDSVPALRDRAPLAAEPTPRPLPASFYARFFSEAAKRRKISPISGLFPLERRPGMISMLAGRPNSAMFPFKSLQFSVESPAEPAGRETLLQVPTDHLAAGIQYGPVAGFPPLLRWLTDLQEREHLRKQNEGWRISVGVGSQDMIYKAVEALVNPGDPVLVECPLYTGVIPMFESLQCQMIEIDTDAQGLSSCSLRSILQNWPQDRARPKVLYTVPYGCNPTGTTTTLQRRKEVLALAREYNFLILEDDPYYFLYFGQLPRPQSYFTLELGEMELGRVLRFDSFSKILSGGIRVGFVTGPEVILDAIDSHTSTLNLQAPGLTQAIAHTLLSHWGYDGFKSHVGAVSEFYRHKRDVFQAAMDKHLSGLVEWTPPEAGMFAWFKCLRKEADGQDGDSEAIIRQRAVERGVLALPGTVFMPDGRKTGYVRAAISCLTDEEIFEACDRLRRSLTDGGAEKSERSDQE